VFARLLFLIDCSIDEICECSFSLAINPAGLSLPELIFNPVDNRCRDVCNISLEACKFRNPRSEGTLVLILVMAICLSVYLLPKGTEVDQILALLVSVDVPWSDHISQW